MLYIIGLGLDDGEITVKGREALEKADKAYAEFYTNTQTVDVKELEKETGTPVEMLEREKVEQEDILLEKAEEEDIAFLVSGDPLTATTHYDIKYRTEEAGIETEVFHAPSIFTAIAETGLNVYKFGRTVTLPEHAKPESLIKHIEKNDSIGLHTLVLLDINYDGREAAEKLVEMEPELAERETVVLERANSDSQEIQKAELAEIPDLDLGETPHALIILGEISHKEDEFTEAYR